MGAYEPTERVDNTSDYHYIGRNALCYPLCCLCMRYSPFLFYLDSKCAMASLSDFLEPQSNVLCAECLPRETPHDKLAGKTFYQPDCLFNNEEFLSLFLGYEYSNPIYELFYGIDRLIITEDAKINANFKTLMRTPLPKRVKVEKIQQLFPPVHRLPFRKYANEAAVFRALHLKYADIRQNYLEVSTVSLHDNIDILVDRTPLHERRSSQKTAPHARVERTPDGFQEIAFPTDSLTLREGSSGSSTEANSLPLSAQPSFEFSEESIPLSDQEVVISGTQQTSSDPVNISSQSANVSSQSLAAFAIEPISSQSIVQQSPVPELLPEANVSSSSSSSSVATVTRPRRSSSRFHSSQEPGPSGLQHQHREQRGNTAPRPKRRREATPVNPSPEEFQQPNNRTGMRMPRLPGG